MRTSRLIVLSAFATSFVGCADVQDPITPMTTATRATNSGGPPTAVGPITTIFSNFGPGMAFDSVTADFTIGTYRAYSGQFRTPPGEYTFARATIALGRVYQPTPFTGASQVRIALQADSLGVPGRVIEEMVTWVVGGPPHGVPPGAYIVNSSLSPVLSDSLYWLTVIPVQTNAWVSWHRNTTGDGGVRQWAHTADFDPRVWIYQSGERGAFQIEGQRVTTMDLCHRTAGRDSYVLISVAPPSADAHYAHGDGRIGDQVRGQPWMRFDSECRPVAAPILLRPSANSAILDANHDGNPDYVRPYLEIANTGAFEFRSVFEFNVSMLTQPIVGHAELRLPVVSSQGPYPIPVDVYAYGADDVMTLSDFAAGSFSTSFAYAGATQAVDVTSALNSLIAAHAMSVGFNLRVPTPGAGVIWFGSLNDGAPAATLVIQIP